MEEFLSHLQLTKPVFLLLLLFLLPLLWMRRRGRSWALILWRSLTFSMLVVALADPARVTEQKVSAVTEARERIFAFDLSRSIPMQMRTWMEQLTKESFCHQRRIAFLFLAVIPERSKIGTSGYEERNRLSLFSRDGPTWNGFSP
jgi:hypothetical protein